MFQLVDVFVFLSAMFACSASLIENHHSGALIITLPLYNQTEPSLENVPDFLRETYQCWSTERSLKHCIPYSQDKEFAFGDINTIRSITGSGYKFENTMRYDFNTDILQGEQASLQHTFIRITKEAISPKESFLLQKRCGVDHGIPITLTIKTLNKTTITSNSVIIQVKDIMNEMAINFTGLTQVFYEGLENSGKMIYELSIGGLCYNQFTPDDLGFTTTNAWIIDFSTKFVMDDTKFFKRYSNLIQNAKDAHYTKRQAEISQEETLINESPCTMYTHWVQLSDLELDFEETIIQPNGFNINYCSGLCSFPQISSPKYNTTKHSHMQSIGAYYNPDIVPRPCCVPHEYSDVEVLYLQTSGMFAKHTFTGVAVKSCGCK